MGYKSLVEIHLAIIFNKQQKQDDKLQDKSKTKLQLQPDKEEMHHNNNNNHKEKEKEKQKSKIVSRSSTCRSSNNSVFVVQPNREIPGFSMFQFFIVKENKCWLTSRKLFNVPINLSSIRRPSLPSSDLYLPTLISSHRGILLFQHKSSLNVMNELVLIFYNPLTRQQVTATVPYKTYILCGFFFHPPTQEYRVLYQLREDRMYTSSSPAATNRYALLGIRSGSFRQIVNSSCPKYCHPDTSTPPVVSNGALHWMVSTEIRDDEEYLQHNERKPRAYNLTICCSAAIFSFGMETEEFRVIPHPSGADCDDDDLCATASYSHIKQRHKREMTLLEMEGKLCLCDGSYYRRKLDIWVMEDYSKKIWIKRYVVRLDKLLPFSPSPADHSELPWVKAVCIHNRNKLVFQWQPWYRDYPDYMLYNLERGWWCRKIREGPLIDRRGGESLGNLVTHTPSSENVGRKTGTVLSLYEDDGTNKLIIYEYELHHRSNT